MALFLGEEATSLPLPGLEGAGARLRAPRGGGEGIAVEEVMVRVVVLVAAILLAAVAGCSSKDGRSKEPVLTLVLVVVVVVEAAALGRTGETAAGLLFAWRWVDELRLLGRAVVVCQYHFL